MLFALLKGIVLGLYIGMPTGPVGALCVARVLERGFWSGIWTGAGSVLANLIYAFIFLFGLHTISDFFNAQTLPLHIGGGVVLIVVGVLLFHKKAREHPLIKKHERGGNFLSGFLITLSNPVQLVSYSLFFITLKIGNFSRVDSFFFILGIFIATSVWWIALSGFVSKFKKGMSDHTKKVLQHMVALIVIFIGLFVVTTPFL